jgi:hypothetical protein
VSLVDPFGLRPQTSSRPPGYNPKTWEKVGPGKLRNPPGSYPRETWRWHPVDLKNDPYHPEAHWDVEKKYPDNTTEWWYYPKRPAGKHWGEKPKSVRRRERRLQQGTPDPVTIMPVPEVFPTTSPLTFPEVPFFPGVPEFIPVFP